MIRTYCRSCIDYVLSNPGLSLILGLLLGVVLTIISVLISNTFDKKMWVKDKRLYYYSKSLEDIKLVLRIRKNIKSQLYDSEKGKKAQKDDLKRQKELMEDYYIPFMIVAEKKLFSLYEKIYKNIQTSDLEVLENLVNVYEEEIRKLVMKGIKK